MLSLHKHLQRNMSPTEFLLEISNDLQSRLLSAIFILRLLLLFFFFLLNYFVFCFFATLSIRFFSLAPLRKSVQIFKEKVLIHFSLKIFVLLRFLLFSFLTSLSVFFISDISLISLFCFFLFLCLDLHVAFDFCIISISK